MPAHLYILHPQFGDLWVQSPPFFIHRSTLIVQISPLTYLFSYIFAQDDWEQGILFVKAPRQPSCV